MQTLDVIRPGREVEVTTLADPDHVRVGTVAFADLVGVVVTIEGQAVFMPYSAVETLTVLGGAR